MRTAATPFLSQERGARSLDSDRSGRTEALLRKSECRRGALAGATLQLIFTREDDEQEADDDDEEDEADGEQDERGWR